MTTPEIPSDTIRRELRELDEAQQEALPAFRELLARVFRGEAGELSSSATAAAPLSRRRAITVGGLTVASSAILAACYPKSKKAGPIPQAGDPTPRDKAPTQVVDDIVLLRTASSLEHTAIAVYDTVLSRGLLTTAALADAAKLFRDHHAQHAQAMEDATTALKGTAFSTPNAIVMANVVQPALAVIKSEADVVAFAHALETLAQATYQSTVDLFTDPKLRAAAMSVGSVEGRHAAVLAGVIATLGTAPGSGMFPAAELPAAATTTTAPKSTGTTVAPPTPVYQVPGPFSSVAEALGPNSYEYYSK
jgi:hypothetical protein